MSEDSKFSIKNTVRNEQGEVIGFTCWENGKKVHFSKSTFDPGDGSPQWIFCSVMYKDGKRTSGKINIGIFERLSDFMNLGPQFIPFCDTTDGTGQKGKFKIVNKDDIREIVPTAGERVAGKIKEWIDVK